MKRREFIVLVSGATAWPFVIHAEQPKTAVIGFLGANTASVQTRWTAAFLDRLGELGWTEGRNVQVEYRWAEGRAEQFTKFAVEFARLKVDVIVTSGTPAALAAKRATRRIPIVFALSADPVASGLVTSVTRPGGNVTGLSNQSHDLIAKRLDLLLEVIPGFRQLAVMANAAFPSTTVEMENVASTAQTLGLEVVKAEIRQSEDVASAFQAINASQALYVCTDSLVFINRVRLNDLALRARLPTIYGFRAYVETGGLMSLGADVAHLFRRAAEYADKVLRGMKPAEIPVEQPTKFELVINLKTAKTLGLTIPPLLLARADEVIE